jgi:RNA polymerase sigma-70 factor (ECF subfamily)
MQIDRSASAHSLPVVDVMGDLLAALPKLRRYATSLGGSPERADDLVQATVVKALANIDSFDPDSNMMAWLYTILRNQFYSEFRKRRYEVEDDKGHYADLLESSPSQEGHMHLLELRQALNQLVPDHREALILVGVSGLSYDDAAAHCGCAVGTIKSRVSRARVRLAVLLGETVDHSPEPDISLLYQSAPRNPRPLTKQPATAGY